MGPWSHTGGATEVEEADTLELPLPAEAPPLREPAQVSSRLHAPPGAWVLGASAGLARHRGVEILAAIGLTLAGGTIWLPVSTGYGEALLVAALASACLVPIAGAIRRGSIDVLELGVAVALAYLLVFPVRAVVVLLNLDFAASQRAIHAPPSDVRLALLSGTLGFLAAGLAFSSSLPDRLARRVRLPHIGAIEAPGLRLALPIFVFGLLAQAGVLVANRTAGAPGLQGRGSGVVSAATVFVLIGLALLTRRVALCPSRFGTLLLGAAMAVTAGLGLAGQFKEVVVGALLAPLLMWHFSRPHGLPQRLVVATGIVVALVIFPLVNVWRLASERVHTSNPAVVAKAFPHQLTCCKWVIGGPIRRPQEYVAQPFLVLTHRLYGYDSFLLAVRYTPSQIPYQTGRSIRSFAAGLVPRVFWPNKPNVGLGFWFAERYWETPQGVKQVPQSVTHPGELWIDFGLPGVIVGLALLGFWYRFAYSALAPWTSGTGALVYIVVFLTVVVVDRDLQFVYVTLLQRLVALGALLGGVALVTRWRRTAAV